MKISLIAAVATNKVIGNNDNLPWKLPEDLRYFREKTWGKALIMGHSTFQSLPTTLDNRRCIVLTRQESITGRGDFVQAKSVEHAMRLAKEYAQTHHHDEIMVGGGSQIYKLFFEYATTMYITEVGLEPEGDAYFPDFDASLWHCSAVNTSQSSTTGIEYRHLVYKLKV